MGINLFSGRLIDISAMGWSNINFVVDCLNGNTYAQTTYT